MIIGKIALPPKTKLLASLALSFAVSFIFFLFAPFDSYLHSPHAFVVGWKFLLPQFIIFTFISFIVLTVVLIMLMQKNALFVVSTVIILCVAPVAFARFVLLQLTPRNYSHLIFFCFIVIALCLLLKVLFKDKAADAALLLMWGILIASYMQLLFLNGDMSPVVSFAIVFTMSASRVVINSVIWVIIAFSPLILWLVFTFRKRAYNYEKAVLFTALLFVGMQIAGLVSTAITTDLPPGFEDGTPQYLSYSPVVELGRDSNIIVFVLEYLDVRYMEEVLEQAPEIYDQLDGFTFYTNNVSEYNGTFPQITKMLTWHDYTHGLHVSEYWKEAWEQHGLVDILKENGYTANLIIDRGSTYGSAEQIMYRADNIRVADGIKYTPVSTAMYMSYISLGRIAPYTMKDIFLRNMQSDFANALYTLGVPDAPDSVVISKETDLFLYEYIQRNNVVAIDGAKVFNFIHLNSAHHTNSLRYNSVTGTIVEGGSNIDSKRANFEILNIYFTQMRAAGVYDNSTIIVIGDHGIVFRGESDGVGPEVTTGLFIKPPGAAGRMERNADAELSHVNFAASILESAGIPHENMGFSYFDIINNNVPQVRFFNDYAWGARGNAYEITGDASDYENWRLIE